MRWGAQLWDGFDKISKYFHDGIEIYEKYEEFLRERCSIEQIYAKNLRKLVKNFNLSTKNNQFNIKNDENNDIIELTHLKFFILSINEVKTRADQHEFIALNIQQELLNKLSILIKTFKDERKKLQEDKNRIDDLLNKSEESLRKSKLKYKNTFKELEKAKDNLYKMEPKSTHNDIVKQQDLCDYKYRLCGSFKSDYAKQLVETNKIKLAYFKERLPTLIDSFQNLEEMRISYLKELVCDLVSIERESLPKIKESLDRVDDSSGLISIDDDSNFILELYKTNKQIPSPDEFEDFKERSYHFRKSLQLSKTPEVLRKRSQTFNGYTNSKSTTTISVKSIGNDSVKTSEFNDNDSNSNNNCNKLKTIDRIKGFFTQKSNNLDTIDETFNSSLNATNSTKIQNEQRFILFKYFEFKTNNKKHKRSQRLNELILKNDLNTLTSSFC